MKKILFALVLALVGVATQCFSQTLTLKNTTSCSNVIFIVYAHDCAACTYSAHCALVSNTISIPIGGSVTYTYVSDLNTTPGWVGGIPASAVSGWDGIMYGTKDYASCQNFLGNNSCVSTATSNLLFCPCTQWHAVWQVDTSGNITVTVTDWN